MNEMANESTKRTNNDIITVGSCDAYIKEFDGEVPEPEAICVEANRLGWVKSGATISLHSRAPRTRTTSA